MRTSADTHRITGLLLGAVLGVTSWTPSVSNAEQPAAVRLTVSVRKTEFVRCEPVVITVHVLNPTDQRKTVVLFRDPWISLVRFSVQDPSGASRMRILVVDPGPTVDSGPRELNGKQSAQITVHETYQATVLQPKTQVFYRDILHYTRDKGNWLLFDKPGRYAIRARIPPIPALQENDVQSDEVTVQVAEPPVEDKEALSLFRDDAPSRHALFVQGLYNKPEIVDRFRSLVARYPKSAYSPYARLALGRSQLEMGQYDDAIGSLEELLDTTPDFPLDLEVRHDIAQANYRKGIKAFQDLIGQHPNWVGSRRAERVLLHGIDP